MSKELELHQKRKLGMESQMALEALTETSRKREEQIIRHTSELYASDELTPERALSAMIGLIEGRKLLSQLSVQAETGVRASRRIEQEIAAAPTKQDKQDAGNRFFRSRA